MSELHDRQLIYDWNLADDDGHRPGAVALVDETLPEASHAVADEEARMTLLRHMQTLHVQGVGLGLLTSASTPDIARLVRLIADEKLRLRPAVTVPAESPAVEQAASLVQHLGVPLQVALVPRRPASAPGSRSTFADALQTAAREHLDARIMVADASRMAPGDLRRLVTSSFDCGFTRLVLCDSAGCVSPDGVGRLVGFVRAIAEEREVHLQLGWFGRNDRDLAVINSLQALYHGADTLHGAALGLGRGAGCTPLDLLLVNLLLLELIDRDLSSLKAYCETAARAFGVEVAVNYPVFGRDAFRTASGVHAAALIKARAKGDHWLADRVYSGVPAGLFGFHQVIDVGPMSGESNAVAWLTSRGIEPRRELVRRIMVRAKASTHTLTPHELNEEIQAFGAAGAASV